LSSLKKSLEKHLTRFDSLNMNDMYNSHKEQLYEIQYNYIHIGNIQGKDRLSITRTLKDCTDLELFEQESIMNLIDFKWNTYTK